MKKLIKLIDKYARLIEKVNILETDISEATKDIEIIKTNVIREIFCFKGIEKLAKELGAEIEIIEKNSECFPFEYFFKYKGIKVCQLVKENEDGRL